MGSLPSRKQVSQEHFDCHLATNVCQNNDKSRKLKNTDLSIIKDSDIDAIVNEIFKLRPGSREDIQQRKVAVPKHVVSDRQSILCNAVNMREDGTSPDRRNEKTSQRTSGKDRHYSMGNKLNKSTLIKAGRQKERKLSKRSSKSNKADECRDRNDTRKHYKPSDQQSIKHRRNIKYMSESSGLPDDSSTDKETCSAQHHTQDSRDSEDEEEYEIQEVPRKDVHQKGSIVDNTKYYEEEYFDEGQNYKKADDGDNEGEGSADYEYWDTGNEDQGVEYEYEDYGAVEGEKYYEQQEGDEGNLQWTYGDDPYAYYYGNYEAGHQELDGINNPYSSYVENPADQYQYDNAGNMMLPDTIYQASNVDFDNYQSYPETYEEAEEKRYMSEKQFDTDIYDYYSPTEQAFAIMAQQKFSYNNNALSREERNEEIEDSPDTFHKTIKKTILKDERTIDPIISCFDERTRLRFGHEFTKSLKECGNCSLFSCSPFFQDRYGKVAKAYNSILRRSISEVEQLESLEMLVHSMEHDQTHWLDLAALIQSDDTFSNFFCKQIATERYRGKIQKKKDLKSENKNIEIWRNMRQNSSRKTPHNLKEIVEKLRFISHV